MNTHLAKNVVETIRNEQQLRLSLLDENPDVAYDHWTGTDAPFVAELCLMLLVALWHQVERDLVGFAARAADNGNEIDGQLYQKRVKELQALTLSKRLKTVHARLKPELCNWYKALEALRLLANCYKHDPMKQPSEALLELLNLETGVSYAPLPESDALQEGLALFISLEKGADYCDIAETFLDVIDLFLADVKRKNQISQVKWGGASLTDFVR